MNSIIMQLIQELQVSRNRLAVLGMDREELAHLDRVISNARFLIQNAEVPNGLADNSVH